MIFFLDENFPKSAEKYLNTCGHDVIDIRSTDHEGLDDHSIFKLAQTKSAIFLTTDRDFFHTIPFTYDDHFGIIIIALRQPNRIKILNKLKWILEQSGLIDFTNKTILLRDNSYTIR